MLSNGGHVPFRVTSPKLQAGLYLEMALIQGSFHVKSIKKVHKFSRPSPILMKLGIVVVLSEKLINPNF